jgi:hypothetical protein
VNCPFGCGGTIAKGSTSLKRHLLSQKEHATYTPIEDYLVAVAIAKRDHRAAAPRLYSSFQVIWTRTFGSVTEEEKIEEYTLQGQGFAELSGLKKSRSSSRLPPPVLGTLSPPPLYGQPSPPASFEFLRFGASRTPRNTSRGGGENSSPLIPDLLNLSFPHLDDYV